MRKDVKGDRRNVSYWRFQGSRLFRKELSNSSVSVFSSKVRCRLLYTI